MWLSQSRALYLPCVTITQESCQQAASSSLYRGREAQPRACGPIDLDPCGLFSMQWRPEPQNASQAVSLLLKTELRQRQSQKPTEDLRWTPLSPWPSELLSYCPSLPASLRSPSHCPPLPTLLVRALVRGHLLWKSFPDAPLYMADLPPAYTDNPYALSPHGPLPPRCPKWNLRGVGREVGPCPSAGRPPAGWFRHTAGAQYSRPHYTRLHFLQFQLPAVNHHPKILSETFQK